MRRFQSRGATLAGTLALCLTPALAWAAESFAGPGMIGGVTLGQSSLQSYDCSDCGSPVGSLDDSDTAFGVFVGYQFNQYAAVHAGYVDLGDSNAAGEGDDWTDKLEAEGAFVRFRGTLPIGNFYAFVEGGWLLWDQKVSFASTSFTDSGTFDGSDPLYGLGAGYRFGRAAVETSWTRFQDVGTNDPDLGHMNDIDLIAVNFTYLWGR